jgi:hypothetical protein
MWREERDTTSRCPDSCVPDLRTRRVCWLGSGFYTDNKLLDENGAKDRKTDVEEPEESRGVSV